MLYIAEQAKQNESRTGADRLFSVHDFVHHSEYATAMQTESETITNTINPALPAENRDIPNLQVQLPRDVTETGILMKRI